MRYIDVHWIHDFDDEPVRLLSEIGPDNFEIRKLEFFRSGIVGYASSSEEHGGTKLGVVEVPCIDEINLQSEFQGVEINKVEFELLWQNNVPRSS